MRGSAFQADLTINNKDYDFLAVNLIHIIQ